MCWAGEAVVERPGLEPGSFRIWRRPTVTVQKRAAALRLPFRHLSETPRIRRGHAASWYGPAPLHRFGGARPTEFPRGFP